MTEEKEVKKGESKVADAAWLRDTAERHRAFAGNSGGWFIGRLLRSMTSGTMRRRRRRRKRRNEAVRQSSKCVFHDVVPGVLAGPVIFTGPFFVSEKGVEGGLFSDSIDF